MKSLAMLNFKNISPSADFYSKLDNLQLQLTICNKNILYITHVVDKLYKLINSQVVDQKLQQQAEEYLEDHKDLDSSVLSPQEQEGQ